jgi:hypothetical protein
MTEFPVNGPGKTIASMKKIIDQLDELLDELKGLGGDMPVIEKNVQAMKSFVAVLQYGISDLAELKKNGVLE